MFALWMLLLISTVLTFAKETTTATNNNITTLYPVSNNTIIRNAIQTRLSDTETRSSDTTTIPNDTEMSLNETEMSLNDTEMSLNYTERRTNDTKTRINDTKSRSNKTETKSIPATQSWKIESGFAESNLTEFGGNTTVPREGKDKKELLRDFKPSQHLGSFFDDDSAEVIKTPVFDPILKKPASGFTSYPKDEYHNHATFNKIPKEIYYTHTEFPYKFEDTIFTRTKEGWQDSLDTKPTVEVPVKVPAGGLYKLPEAFKDKPYSSEDFALEYHEDGKEHAVKKRVNPWQQLLRLVTAFIPVGLIISALTPSIITIHNVDDNQQPSSLPYRRSDPGVPNIAPISERCRRRLLCELQSERNYVLPSSIPRRTMKHCYKIHCEDTDALWRTLRWLFTYNQGTDGQRGRTFT